MRIRTTSRHRAPLFAGAILLCVGGTGACGPDPDQLSKDVEQRVRRDLDQRVRAEVDRRLRAELPRLEARLKAQLSDKAPPPIKPRPRPPADPAVNPTLDPARPQPAMTADPEAAAEPKPDPKGLKVKRQVIVKSIQDRKPTGEGTSFTVADGQVYCYLDTANPKGPERFLSVAWIRNGKPFHTVRLRVGVGYVWRTWARLRLRPQSVGKWQCAVSNEEGQLLGRAEFTVQ